MSSRARLVKFVAAVVAVSAFATAQPWASANGIALRGSSAASVVPRLSDPGTSVPNPSPTPWSNSSTINVTTQSTGSVTYGVDGLSTATGCAVTDPSDTSATITATGAGNCVIDVSVAGDANYDPSSAQPTVVFTPAAATTSALASPSSTAWSSTSTMTVTTDSTGTVSFTVDSASTAAGCAVSTSGIVSATGAGNCVIDVSVTADPNYLASSAQATVSFSAPGSGAPGPTSISQKSPTTGTVTSAASGTFTAGPITVSGSTGSVAFVVTTPSPGLSVSSAGLISTTGTLSGGTYSVSGTDSDARGDQGVWSFSLSVTATVSFSPNGGVGTMTSESASSPSALTLNTFTRKGYTFTGWNTQASGGGVAYANGSVFPFVTSTTLFAQWKRGALPLKTVQFKANGGSGHTPSEVENAPTAIKANRFTRRGYVFVDWSTTAKGKGTSFEAGKIYNFKKSLTLYARWKKKAATKTPKPPTPPKKPADPAHIVTFLANGGSGTMTSERKRLRTSLTSNEFRRSGYTFLDWNTRADGQGVSYANGAAYSFKTSLSLYAQWKKSVPVPLPIPDGTIIGPFSPGSTTLTAGLKSQLQAVATLAKAKKATLITLYGCGDQMGSTSPTNLALARARAGAVATYLGARLAKEGLKSWSISVTTASPSPSEVGSVVVTLS